MKTGFDLWLLPLEGDRKPVPWLQTSLAETQGRISPDGRWVAYVSDESSKLEVYVQPFRQGSGGKWQISTGGGNYPRWRKDGKELFYLAPNRKIMSVEVRAAASFESAVPKALFDTRLGVNQRFAVTADGKRFLMPWPLEEASSQPLTLVFNWNAALRR